MVGTRERMIDSFTILSKNHFLLGVHNRNARESSVPSLDVYEFGRTMDTPILRRQFQLPDLSSENDDVELDVHAEPMPNRATHSDSPFFSSPASRACTVNVTLGGGDERSSFFFLINKLLERVSDPTLGRVAIPWEDWGVPTRWFKEPMPDTAWVRIISQRRSGPKSLKTLTKVCYSHNSRIISRAKGGAAVTDFNPWSLRKPKVPGVNFDSWLSPHKPKAPGGCTTVDVDRKSVFDSRYIVEPVKTRLPYRLSHKGDIPNYSAFMIDDEHIYGVVVSHSSRSMRYELTKDRI